MSASGDAPRPFPRLLYICDFPPSDFRGGTILMRRLLAGWPAERLTVLASAAADRPELRASYLPCEHVFLPMTDETGRWGVGRLKMALNWLLTPLVAAVALWHVARRRPDALLAVAHGTFFLAAALAAVIARTPLLLVVHDDWTGFRSVWPFDALRAPLFRLAGRRAGAIYVVSPQMQQLLLREYGLRSTVQMPAREAPPPAPAVAPAPGPLRSVRVVYLGTLTGAVDDAIATVAEAMNGEHLRTHGLDEWRLELYTLLPAGPSPYQAWASERVQFRPWVGQDAIDALVAEADILLLPFSFRADQRFLTVNSFPSKTADYLAAGRPVLVVAPPDTSAAAYALAQGFAEVVCERDPAQVAAAIGRIAGSAEHRARLTARAAATFAERHDIARQRRELIADVERLGRRPVAGATPPQSAPRARPAGRHPALAAALRALGRQDWLRFGVRNRIIGRFFAIDATPHHPFEAAFFGMVYPGDLGSYLDWVVYFFGAYEKQELYLLRDLIAAAGGGAVLDIGANVGHHTLFLARHSRGVVHAFEPYPPALRSLYAKLARNGVRNVVVHPVGLGAADQTLRYAEPAGANQGTGSFALGGAAATARFPVVHGDRYLARAQVGPVSVIKIDVEGYERPVLAGLGATLAAHRPAVMLEWSGATAASFGGLAGLRALLPAGYRVAGVATNRPLLGLLNRPGYRLTAADGTPCENLLLAPAELFELPALRRRSPRRW